MSQDTPNIIRGIQGPDYKALFFSEPMAALKIPITLRSGYGVVNQGTLMAECTPAGTGTGYYIPYNPTTFATQEGPFGKAWVVATPADEAIVIAMEDSYKFAVGDSVILNATGVTKEDMGAIISIDRTSSPVTATLNVTATVSSSFTVALQGYVAVEAGIEANNYSDAVGILDKDVDTGTGVNAKGANATLIVKNAILYTSALANIDGAARTDLSASELSRFHVL